MASAKEIRESLIKQLRDQGADVAHYTDLIEDYLKLRTVKRKLLEDISKRKATYDEKSSTGVMMHKTNPAVKDLTNVSRQMLQILREMNLTTENAGGLDDGEL